MKTSKIHRSYLSGFMMGQHLNWFLWIIPRGKDVWIKIRDGGRISYSYSSRVVCSWA